MKFKIKFWNDSKKVVEIEGETFKIAFEIAVRAKIDFSYANLTGANLSGANLTGANLSDAKLTDAKLTGANLTGANLSDAKLTGANLSGANLTGANLSDANLTGAYLSDAYLAGANLSDAYLTCAYLTRANLTGAYLTRAYLTRAKNLGKTMGVIAGNCYYKRFEKGLKNNYYQFYVGLNELREGEVFESDERIPCGHPAFHFASKSWCDANYGDRPLEALIKIPLDAKINEPWATDGKASADKIEILQVWDTKTGKDVTSQYFRPKKVK